MPRDIRALLWFLMGALLVSALVFLFSGGFFSRWDGRIVSVHPDDVESSRLTVLIVTDEDSFQRSLPGDLVRSLALPEDPFAVVPLSIDPARPATKKSRYTLHALVRRADEGASWEVVPTTSPQTLTISLVVLLLLVAARNMAVSGVPWRLRPAERYHPTKLAPTGQAAPTARVSTSKKGPPPPKPQKGRGRR